MSSTLTRGSDVLLGILSETPSQDHLLITGCKLPTCKQILFCHLANIEKLRAEDNTKNKKIIRLAANKVINEANTFYQKSKSYNYTGEENG